MKERQFSKEEVMEIAHKIWDHYHDYTLDQYPIKNALLRFLRKFGIDVKGRFHEGEEK